jgi:hypothetical protein
LLPIRATGRIPHHQKEKTVNSTILDGQQNSYGLAVLGGLQVKHVYGGTVPAATRDRRRAANKVARRSRRLNRR